MSTEPQPVYRIDLTEDERMAFVSALEWADAAVSDSEETSTWRGMWPGLAFRLGALQPIGTEVRG